jgi:hypothetical protein
MQDKVDALLQKYEYSSDWINNILHVVRNNAVTTISKLDAGTLPVSKPSNLSSIVLPNHRLNRSSVVSYRCYISPSLMYESYSVSAVKDFRTSLQLMGFVPIQLLPHPNLLSIPPRRALSTASILAYPRQMIAATPLLY